MSFGEFFQAFGSLGDGIRESQDRSERKAALSKLGEQLQGGDYVGAARTAFNAGDASTGMNLLKMVTDRQNQAANATALGGLIGGLYGGQPAPGAALGDVSSAGPTTPRLPTFADASGADGGYISNLFRRESGGNPNARPSTSGAAGLGQFIPGTWNATARAHPELGLTPIVPGAPDPRKDERQMVAATKALTADNEAVLNQAGLPINDASRYALHFLGAGAGPKLVAGAMSNPDAPAASFAGSAAVAANRPVFFNKDGSAKSAGQVMGDFQRSFGGGGRQAAQTPVSVPTFGGLTAQADAAPAIQMPGVIASPPMPPQRPVQLASADPSSLQLPAGATGANPAAPAFAPAAPRQVLQAPAPVMSAQPAMQMPPLPDSGPAQTGALPANPTAAPPPPAAPAQAAPAQADDGEDGPAQPVAPAAVPPQVRAQVSAQAPQRLAQAGLPQQVSAPVGATAPASQQRIQALLRASMLPGLSEGQSKVVSTLLSNELEQTKLPESVKQYIFARSPQGGGFDGSFADFQNKKGDEGAKIDAQLAAREKWLVAHGMDPKDPGNQAWIMGGKTQSGRVLHQNDELRGPNGQLLARNESSGSGSMPDQTADLLAERVLAGDTKALIGLGRGAQGAENLSKIQGLVAQKAQERGLDASDILRNAAEAQGMGAQARTLGTQAGRMSAAATEAEGAIELARTASAAVPRGSFVPLNRLSQAIQSNTGDPSLKAFNAANNTLVNTFARAISPSGVGTVADKEHAREMLSTADSPQAYEAVLKQMQAEIDMAHKAPQRARDVLERERQGAKRGAAESPPTMVPNPVAPTPAPAQQPAPNAPKPAAADRFGQLVGSGLNKQQAYQRLREEGY